MFAIQRLIGAASILYVLATVFVVAQPSSDDDASRHRDSDRHRDVGQLIFRYDTFGDEQLWTDFLRMHEVIPAKVDPMTALSVGLKVDVDALPAELIAQLNAKEVNLADPAVTVELIRLNAVVGLRGMVEAGTLIKVGITCALCHSTVDNSFDTGIGKRLDGWANTDLNPGAILSLSPALDAGTKEEFGKWGPGKYDPRHHVFNGTNIIPLNSPSLPVVIPPIYGLTGVGFETYTADGPISYWNRYVGVSQMGGQGRFNDRRIGVFINQRPDLVGPKLATLLDYQLRLLTPTAPAGSFNAEAAERGRALFRDEARCSRCHRGSTFTDVLSGPWWRWPFLHDPAEVGMEPEYAARSATGDYRTTPLRALWQHPPYFHDGSAPDLPAVVEHYDDWFDLNLTDPQKADLVEYLKSI